MNFVISVLLLALLSSCGNSDSQAPVATVGSDDSLAVPVVTFSSDQSKNYREGARAEFRIELSSAPTKEISLSLKVNYISATANDLSFDTSFTIASCSQNCPTSYQFPVSIVNDDLDEFEENFSLSINQAVNATIGAQATVADITIAVDTSDQSPILVLANPPSEPIRREGDGLGSSDFQFKLDRPSGKRITVDYTITGSGVNASDFTAKPDRIVFVPGQTSQTLSVEPIDDSIGESREVFVVTILPPENAILGATNTGSMTLEDNGDSQIELSFSTASSRSDEGASTDISIELSSVATGDVAVILSSSGNLESSEYNLVSPLVISAGAISGALNLTLNDNAIYENDKTLSIKILSVTSTSTGDSLLINPLANIHELTIVNDDLPPIISFASIASSTPESSTASIQVKLSSVSGLPVSVDYAIDFATATVADLATSTSTTGSLIFAVGQTSKTITLGLNDDSLYETDESLDITLSDPEGGTLGSISKHTLTISSDDVLNIIPPSVTSVELDNDKPITAQDRVRVRFVASSSSLDISDYYIKHSIGTATSPSAPATTDSGWSALATSAKSVDVSVDYFIGKASRGDYKNIYVYTWVRDTNGNVSSATTAYDSIKQTSPILFADSAGERADPLIAYQWHLRNTAQANFGSLPGLAGIDLNLQKTFTEYGIKGKGVLVNVLDSGLEIGHEDLVDNIDADGGDDFSSDGIGGDLDPSPVLSGGDHGTSVSGLIVMKEGNDKGGVGVAPEATLIGHNYLKSDFSSSVLARSLGADASNSVSSSSDVINMSFGISSGRMILVDTVSEELFWDRLKNGRNGLGTVMVKSSGNGYQQFNNNYDCTLALAVNQSCEIASDDDNSLPIVVTSAVNASGTRSYYSTAGSANFISGLAGEDGRATNISTKTGLFGVGSDGSQKTIWSDFSTYLGMATLTSDVSGCNSGYSRSYSYSGSVSNIPANFFEYDYDPNSRQPVAHSDNDQCSYTSIFNGTSAAAPVVSGVIALMLEANPDLTYWDVRRILAKTARKVDPNYKVITSSANGYLDYELSPGWITNAAGYNFSDWYGFGLIDADAAVDMALNYDTSSSITTAKITDVSVDSGVVVFFELRNFVFDNSLNYIVPNNNINGVSHTLNLPTDLSIDAVAIYVATTTSVRDTQVELTSPSGTTYVAFHAANGHKFNTAHPYSLTPNARLAVNAFYGESSAGNWTVSVKDLFSKASGGSDDEGFFYGWKLQVIGH